VATEVADDESPNGGFELAYVIGGDERRIERALMFVARIARPRYPSILCRR
jgi:hypothetical protein